MRYLISIVVCFVVALLLGGCASSQTKAEKYCVENNDLGYESHADCVQAEIPNMNKGMKALGKIFSGAGNGLSHAQDNTVNCTNWGNGQTSCTDHQGNHYTCTTFDTQTQCRQN